MLSGTASLYDRPPLHSRRPSFSAYGGLGQPWRNAAITVARCDLLTLLKTNTRTFHKNRAYGTRTFLYFPPCGQRDERRQRTRTGLLLPSLTKDLVQAPRRAARCYDGDAVHALNALPYLDAAIRQATRLFPVATSLRERRDTFVYTYPEGHGLNFARFDTHKPWIGCWEWVLEVVQSLPGIWSNVITALGGPRTHTAYYLSLAERVHPHRAPGPRN
ncbi:hypothetical protein C8Q72DRAFT_799344 [Fomitopsis betulina]|nr:hypothetical protein C8Q72DRAFT_799344 [Fomitopsis betulina]